MSQLKQDLAYIKDVVENADNDSCQPRAIFFLWAPIYFVGFSLIDLSGRYAGLFWMIAGPGGGIISYWLGHRWAMRTGRAFRREGARHLLHWLGLAAATFLSLPLLWSGAISSDALAKIILLISAFGLFTAGIYLARPYMWVGLAMAVCYLGSLTVTNLPWVVVGAVSGGAMMLIGLLGNRTAN